MGSAAAVIELTRLGRASLMRGSRLPRLAVRPADSDRIRRNSLLRRLSVPMDSDDALAALGGRDGIESGRAAGRRGSSQEERRPYISLSSTSGG